MGQLPNVKTANHRATRTAVSGRYARYIGRVGALAVALGVGTMPGLAWAAPDTGNVSDTAGQPPSSPSDPAGATNTPSTPSPTPSPAKNPAPQPDPGADTGTGVPGNQNGSSQVTVTVGEGSSPSVTVSGSGGANTTVGENHPTKTAEPEPSVANQPVAPSTPAQAEPAPVVPDPTAPPTPDPTPAPKKGDSQKPATKPPASADPVTATKTVVTGVAPSVVGLATPAAAPTPNADAPKAFATAPAEPMLTIADTTTGPSATASSPQTVVDVAAQLVSAVLSPLVVPSPNSPAAPALLWAVLAWTRRESERTALSEVASSPVDSTTTSQPIDPEPLTEPTATARTFAATETTPTTMTASLMAAAVPAGPNQKPSSAPALDPVDLDTGIVTGNLNATDPNGDALTFVPKTAPTKGAVVIDGTGFFTYTPTAPARHAASATPGTDVDSFAVTVSDGRGGVVTAQVRNVPVTPQNSAPINPIARPDAPNPTTGVVTGTVSADDPDDDSLKYTGSTTTAKGKVVVNANGTFTYTPTAAAQHAAVAGGPAASDSFTVTVTDGHGGSLAVPVPVTVNPKNAAPTNGSATVGQPNSATGVVTGTVKATDADKDALIFTGSTSTAKGAVVVNPNGSFTYTPTEQARHAALAGGDAAKDSFTVTVSDGLGGTLAVPVSVTVKAKNAAPANGSAAVGEPDLGTGLVTGTVSATDSDGDTLRYTGPTSTNKGTVLVNSNGTFTYTPTDAARHKALAGGAAATDSFTVTASDGLGGTLAVRVPVTISPKNAAPINGIVSPSALNPTTGVVTGRVTASDPDDDSLKYTGSTTTAKGKVVVNANGTFTYTPTAAAQHAAAAGGVAATDTFTVTASDPYGGTLAVTVPVAVNAKNKAPINGTAIVGEPDLGTGVVTGRVTATDQDGDTLKYSGPTFTTKGDVVVNENGTFTYTPTDEARHAATAGGAAAADSFTVTVDDAHGGTLAVTVPVKVSPANTAPVATAVPTVGSPNGDGVITGKLNVTDADGDALSYQVVTGPSKGVVTIDNVTGTYTYAPTNQARLQASLTTGTVETDTFTIGVTDRRSAPVSVTVRDVLVAELPVNSVVATPAVGDSPRAVALSPDGSRAYVANTDDDTVTVLNTADNSTVRTITVGDRPTAIALNSTGGTVYVANAGGSSVTSIDAASGAVLGTVNLGHEPSGIAVSPDNNFVYTANADSTVTIITVADGHTATIAIDPSTLVTNSTGTRLYALNSTDGDVLDHRPRRHGRHPRHHPCWKRSVRHGDQSRRHPPVCHQQC